MFRPGLQLAPATALFCFLSAAVVIAAPLWVLLLSPIILGVPHVASDIRYLVVSPLRAEKGRGVQYVLIPIAILLLLGILAVFGIPRQLPLEISLGMLAVGIALIQGRSPEVERGEGRTLALVAALLVLTGLLIQYQRQTLVALLHLHNLIALGIWFTLFRGASSLRESGGIVLSFAIGALACAGFSFFVPELTRFGPAPAGFGALDAASALLPGLSLYYGAVLIRLYAFLQMMHYVIWLFLVPGSQGHSIIDDLGGRWIALFGALTLAVIAAGWFLPVRTRELYLTTSSFHAWLEIGVGSYLLARTARERRVSRVAISEACAKG